MVCEFVAVRRTGLAVEDIMMVLVVDGVVEIVLVGVEAIQEQKVASG